MASNDQGFPIPVGGAPNSYSSQYDQYAYESNPHTEKSHEEKLKEKARKWQQLQNKRYGEKRKFGMYPQCRGLKIDDLLLS
jgi:pre-mRNA-processing factor 8